jgi:transposase
MLSVGRARVFLAASPVDLRRGHDGLYALVRGALAMDPYAGDVFVFVGRRGDRVKILFWDRGGFVVYYKRLAKGRVSLPRIAEGAAHVVMDGTELGMLLGGFRPSAGARTAAWEPRRPAA